MLPPEAGGVLAGLLLSAYFWETMPGLAAARAALASSRTLMSVLCLALCPTETRPSFWTLRSIDNDVILIASEPYQRAVVARRL
eukprot:1139485-Alexandrium_andersonii.AAC.1